MSPYNKLWTKTAFAKVPAIGSQDGKGDNAVAHVKIFALSGRWYVLEYDPETGRAFCLHQNTNGDVSIGYSPINEVNPGDWDGEDMQSQNNQWKEKGYRFPPFERDSSFGRSGKGWTVAEIKASIERGNPA